MASGLGISLFMIVMGFLTRKLFVDNLGVEYLGLNGLLHNILGVTTLLEGGFATSVIYNMYKPLAENDQPRILALLQLYKKVYRYIALGIFIFSLLLYPFIGYFIKDADSLDCVSVVYFIFVFNSLIGYFSAYKWSLINAAQKNYKLTLITLCYQLGLYLVRIPILLYMHNYILYLLGDSLLCLLMNYAVVKKADSIFPYVKTNVRYQVEPSVKANIIQNMKYIFIINIGTYLMHSTDNIIISSFVGISIVGLYSNYTLITGIIQTMVRQILNSFADSMGDLVASESSERVYEVYKTIFFVNFLAVSIPCIILYCTLTPFISWWLGEEYQMPMTILSIIIFNFYIMQMRESAITLKGKSGIFYPDRYTTLLQGIINVFLSIAFVKLWGLAGVLLGTGLSVLSIGFWQYPRICYKYIFKKSLWLYFRQYVIYTIAAISALILSILLCKLVVLNNPLLTVFANGVVCIFCILFVYYLTFRKTQQYQSLLVYITNIFHK